MVQARLLVTLPDGTWVKDVSTEHPAAQVEVLSAVPGRESGFALVRIRYDDLDAFLAAMDAHPAIEERTALHRSDRETTIHFQTARPLLLFSAREAGMPIELPMEISDGVARVDVTGSRERLSELAAQLDSFGLEFDVEYVRDLATAQQLLSDRQRELVTAATERGYYDTPRECSLTELADDLGIAKSTCSELLHRAEGTIIKEYVSDMPAEPPLPLP